ncbi:hypothetical protein AB6805_13565 [Chitinophaga sp. RCC_12]|uniref:hypothetical protein n=1 Tax=Chitinophaga sp. RCC_12 TaxID=3239226 RepID=UPI0035249B03
MTEHQIEQAISDFTTFMYQKGYRAKFALVHTVTERIFFSGNLSECLKQFFKLHPDNSQHVQIKLSTSLPYEPNIYCSLDLQFDPVKGFLIKAMRIVDLASRQKRKYQGIQSNLQIPGASSLYGLFPKKKPWDDFFKGKRFRP